MNQHMTFQIHGEHVTRMARNLVLDGDWQTAYNMLKKDFEGIPEELIVSILSGNHKLTGINVLDINEDNDEEYKKDVAYMYAGLVKNGSSVYKPYAVIHRFQDDDIPLYEGSNICSVNGQLTARMNAEDFSRRAKFYAQNDDDLVKSLSVGGKTKYVLFTKKENYPLWINPKTTDNKWQESLDECESLEAIEHINRSVESGKIEPIEETPVIGEVDDVPDVCPKPNVDSLVNKFKTLQKYDDTDLSHRLVTDGNYPKYGWILEDGSFYRADYMEHDYVAELIATEVYGMEYSTNKTYRIILEKNGALDAGKNVVTHQPWIIGLHDHTYTQAQKETVTKWAEQNNIPIQLIMEDVDFGY